MASPRPQVHAAEVCPPRRASEGPAYSLDCHPLHPTPRQVTGEQRLHIALPLVAGGIAFGLMPLFLHLGSMLAAFCAVSAAVVAADATTGNCDVLLWACMCDIAQRLQTHFSPQLTLVAPMMCLAGRPILVPSVERSAARDCRSCFGCCQFCWQAWRSCRAGEVSLSGCAAHAIVLSCLMPCICGYQLRLWRRDCRFLYAHKTHRSPTCTRRRRLDCSRTTQARWWAPSCWWLEPCWEPAPLLLHIAQQAQPTPSWPERKRLQ